MLILNQFQRHLYFYTCSSFATGIHSYLLVGGHLFVIG